MWRVPLAFTVCALGYPLVVVVSDPQHLGGAVYVATFTIAGSLILGVPAFLYFRKRSWWELWRFVVGGLAAGAIVSLPFSVAGLVPFLFFAATFSVIGAAHALAFWLIAVWNNRPLTRSASIAK